MTLRNFGKTIKEATNVESSKKNTISEIYSENDILMADKKEISTALNSHFAKIGHNIAPKQPKTSNKFIVSESLSSSSMFLFPITETELIKIVKSLKNNTSPGIDKIDTHLTCIRTSMILRDLHLSLWLNLDVLLLLLLTIAVILAQDCTMQ